MGDVTADHFIPERCCLYAVLRQELEMTRLSLMTGCSCGGLLLKRTEMALTNIVIDVEQ